MKTRAATVTLPDIVGELAFDNVSSLTRPASPSFSGQFLARRRERSPALVGSSGQGNPPSSDSWRHFTFHWKAAYSWTAWTLQPCAWIRTARA